MIHYDYSWVSPSEQSTATLVFLSSSPRTGTFTRELIPYFHIGTNEWSHTDSHPGFHDSSESPVVGETRPSRPPPYLRLMSVFSDRYTHSTPNPFPSRNILSLPVTPVPVLLEFVSGFVCFNIVPVDFFCLVGTPRFDPFSSFFQVVFFIGHRSDTY